VYSIASEKPALEKEEKRNRQREKKKKKV